MNILRKSSEAPDKLVDAIQVQKYNFQAFYSCATGALAGCQTNTKKRYAAVFRETGTVEKTPMT
ncbi:MAG: hypothetical protein AB9861_06305 [Methanosarcina sp.]|jgi:hypothetical protein